MKIRGPGKNSNMKGHTKFLGGVVEEIEGARFSRSLLQRGVLSNCFVLDESCMRHLLKCSCHQRKRKIINYVIKYSMLCFFK